MSDPAANPGMATRELVARLGPHPTRTLGIELAAEGGPEHWLVAACLLAGRGPEAAAERAYRALGGVALLEPSSLARAHPPAVEKLLAEAGYRGAETAAPRLVRAAAALCERYGGSLTSLAAAAGDLEELAGRIGGLAPGIGRSTVARFLRPLREHWTAAREVPLHPGARSAAVHVGLLREGEDLEGEPGGLAAALAADPDGADPADVEAALERLGARACGRERPERCPLGEDCPARPR